MHKGRLPHSYFGAAKYSLVMTFLFSPVRQPIPHCEIWGNRTTRSRRVKKR